MFKNKVTKFFIAAAASLIVVNLNFSKVSSQKLCDRRYLNDEIRIHGKVVIVTGGTGGLGFYTAQDLARRGGRIYLAARGRKNGAEAVETIIQSTGNKNVTFIPIDLGSLKSIRQFSETFHSIESRLDILINNAAIASHQNKTEDGFETNMGVNHLGHFLLTNLLLDLLKASAPSRIVVVSSGMHVIGALYRNNFNSEILFPGVVRAYANSKLANILFTRELSKRLQNTNVSVNCLDPGFSKSSLGENLHTNLRLLMQQLQEMFGRDAEYAAQSHIMLAVDPSVNDISGKYFVDCMQKEPLILLRDDNMASWLWNESARLTRLDQCNRM